MALGAIWWVRRFQDYTPVEALQDLQAAAKVRNAPQPVERFLELRYGPLTEPANRQKAFLDFFNVGHIKGLQMLTSRMGEQRRQASISAMARWVSSYRESMTSAEREALGRYIRSEGGMQTLQRATAQYLRQDVHFRAATAPVIGELMTTLAAAQKP